MTAAILRNRYFSDSAPKKIRATKSEVSVQSSAPFVKFSGLIVEANSAGQYVRAKGHARPEQEEVDHPDIETVAVPSAPPDVGIAVELIENSNPVMLYPRSIVYAFSASIFLFAAALVLLILNLLLPAGVLVDASLLALTIGGALWYGCLTKAEEIDEWQPAG